jgi:predicted CDP-diglyceride synthetase/phosphatidate cytidylyltransferase
MTGIEQEYAQTIHFLLMGNSKEHILHAIDHYSIQKMVLVTSDTLYDENVPFIMDIQKRGIDVLDVMIVNPFSNDCMETMIQEILGRYEAISNTSQTPVIFGLTGGTNLMAIAMSFVALLKNLRCHYIVKNQVNKIIEIDLFERLEGAITCDQLKLDILIGENK